MGSYDCINFAAVKPQRNKRGYLIGITLVRIMTWDAKTRSLKYALLVGLFVIQFGCAKKEAIHSETLITDLQRYFDARPNCAAIAISFPAEIQDLSNDPYSELLSALEAGELIRRVPTHTVNRFIPSTRFEVTEIGSRYLHSNSDKYVGGSQLCYSHRHVLSIISIERIGKSGTQPELLRVSYRFEQQGNGPWSFLPGVQDIALPNAPATKASHKTVTDILVHTESGWEPKG
jgi:hypothetical protein